MAGAANWKIRLTARNSGLIKWTHLNFERALTVAGWKSREGIILLTIKWLSFSKGVKLTYAYHLMFSRDEIDLNQLSFGISGGLIQSQLDETSFTVGILIQL
jgi:hypothetical protein